MSFALAVKSTIDKIVFDLSQASGCDFFDIDGSYMAADFAESEKRAFTVGSFVCAPNPRDPFYSVSFEVSAKTSNDRAQYDSLDMVSKIQELFKIGDQFYVSDYSGEALPTDVLGYILIAYTVSDTPGFDKISGLRPVRITASGFQFPQL